MNPRNRLSWRYFGRGLLTLRKKIGPGARTLATLATMRDRRRASPGRALERSAARHPDATCIEHDHGEISYGVFNSWVNRPGASRL